MFAEKQKQWNLSVSSSLLRLLVKGHSTTKNAHSKSSDSKFHAISKFLMTCLLYLLLFLTHEILKGIHLRDEEGKGKPRSNLIFSFEQQTSKIYLALSNNYMKNDQMLPVDGTLENYRLTESD